MQKSENLPNGWTDWHQIWYTSADSSRNGHRLKTISPSICQGALGGGGLGVKNSKGKSTKRLDRLEPNLVHVCRFIWEWPYIGSKQTVPRDPGVILGFRWSKCNQRFEECHDLQRKNENKLYKNEMHK